MKLIKITGILAAAALALTAFAGTASATTLEVGGVPQSGPVTFHMTLEPGTSVVSSDTSQSFANTCTESTIKNTTTTPFTGTRVGGANSTLSFGSCTSLLTADNPGYLEFERIAGTTNATAIGKSAEFTAGTPFGTFKCTSSASGIVLGTLTGKASGQATLDLNAVLTCGFFLPSLKLEGKYLVTTPEGLGVTS
jgi:hypothetical protein